jgi:hypothetical protein
MHFADGLVSTNKGVSHGSVLSSLLLNRGLDGIDFLVNTFPYMYLDNKQKLEYLKHQRSFKKNKIHFYFKGSAWFVRYVDAFVIGLRVQPGVYLFALNKLREFLVERGLEFFETKTVLKKQKSGYSLDFLGWRFYYMNKKKDNLMMKGFQSFKKKLYEGKEVNVYPSPDSTKFFREAIKFLTRSSRVNSSIYKTIFDLRGFIKD